MAKRRQGEEYKIRYQGHHRTSGASPLGQKGGVLSTMQLLGFLGRNDLAMTPLAHRKVARYLLMQRGVSSVVKCHVSITCDSPAIAHAVLPRFETQETLEGDRHPSRRAALTQTIQTQTYLMTLRPKVNMSIDEHQSSDRTWMPRLTPESWGHANNDTQQHVDRASILPPGFPQRVHAKMVWSKADYIGQPEKYHVVLNDVHIREVEAAGEYFKGRFSVPRCHCHESTDDADHYQRRADGHVEGF